MGKQEVARARWRPLIVGGGWNAELRRAFAGNSGAYAIRDKKTRRVVYVGESNTGRGWKTLTRHFQDASGKFAKLRETFTSSTPDAFEASLWVTSKGARKEGDPKAMSAQAELITRFRKEGHKLVNVDDGRASVEALRTSGRDRRLAAHARTSTPAPPPSRDVSNEEEDYFGSFSNPKNPPPKLVDVPTERRADARTPDLFTGRTRLEEGGKAQRRDWKGDAERLARELAACRAPQKESSPEQKKPSLPPPPPKRPEGFGELDAKGQAGMFRNPGGLVSLGYLVSIAYRDASGRRRVMHWGARRAPIVAYDPAKKAASLVLIFAPSYAGEGTAKGEKEYKRTHWGQAGAGERLAGDVLRGKAPKLGTALEITYATSKGADVELVNYWHVFGDYGTLALKKAFIPPAVVAATLGGRQLVRLDGGTYTVTAHGIVG